MFLYYLELDKLISAKRFLTETEINTAKTLCMGFGNFTKYFPNENISRKIHELVFDVSCFLAKHKKHWDTLAKRKARVSIIP